MNSSRSLRRLTESDAPLELSLGRELLGTLTESARRCADLIADLRAGPDR